MQLKRANMIVCMTAATTFLLGLLPRTTNAAPLDDASHATILRYDNDNIGVDGYNFGFETSDGITRQEEAQLKNVGTEQEAISVRGSVSWVAPDGQTYTLNYIADENGFQPQGDHLPHT